MTRKLAAKNWLDRVPSSAMSFVNGIVLLSVGSILYAIVGPPPRELSVTVKILIIVVIVMGVNQFIFIKRDKYKTIVEYYDAKYIRRPPRITYFIIPMCYILLFYIMNLIHDHYGDYYRIHGLK
jgi:hypothetical protein